MAEELKVLRPSSTNGPLRLGLRVYFNVRACNLPLRLGLRVYFSVRACNLPMHMCAYEI